MTKLIVIGLLFLASYLPAQSMYKIASACYDKEAEYGRQVAGLVFTSVMATAQSAGINVDTKVRLPSVIEEHLLGVIPEVFVNMQKELTKHKIPGLIGIISLASGVRVPALENLYNFYMVGATQKDLGY